MKFSRFSFRGLKVPLISQTEKATWRNETTYRLPLNRGPLAPQDVLQLSEVLNEGHHLRLEALGVHVLHRGHLEAHANVVLPPQQRVGPSIPRNGKNVTHTAARYKLVFEGNLD